LPLLTILMASLAEGRDAETTVKKESAVSAAEGRHSGVDLVLHFNTQNTGISEGDTEAVLTGQLASGQSLEGSDSVRIVPGSKKGKAGKVVAAGMQSTSWGEIKNQLKR
jgi:hypothetical protein